MTKASTRINRRTFLSQAASGMGAAAVSSLACPFVQTALAKSRNDKKLLATTDYRDNVLVNGCFMDKAQLDALHRGLASLGVTRHQWIVDTIWTLYEDHPHGLDLLAEAVASAHRHGIELYAQIKPFEGGGFGEGLPLSMPMPKDAVALRDLRGIFPVARPFVARHPEMCLKRRPGTHDFRGPVTTIRLVKRDDRPTRVQPEHLSIWTSSSNSGFTRYTGPVSFRENVEWRHSFPGWRQCRILHLEDLKIAKDQTYVLVRCSLADEQGDFMNEMGSILELAGLDGQAIALTMGRDRIELETHRERLYGPAVHKRLVRYLQLPEVQAELNDPEKMRAHYRDFFRFNKGRVADSMTLDRDGFVVAACGKPEYMLGNLHPIYPEVREHWLDLVRFCLDRGVDGLNFRPANHTRSPEFWDYGFNEPVLEATGGRTDYASVSRVNGDAFTRFLREARALLTSRGKGLTLHLHAAMLRPDERGPTRGGLPPNFQWQWETWTREIADDLEFRGAFKLRSWNVQSVLDTFAAATRAAGKPLYYQSDFHSLANEEGHRLRKRHEIDFVKSHDGLDGYVLYETANYTRLNDRDYIEVKPYMEELIKNRWF